jgi:GNAT superfamily N-acetyltransferase
VAVPAGWATDVEVLRLGGSAIEDHGDHVVVRSPRNPTHHWGNFVLVADPAQRNRAHRWVEVFAEEFPDAAHTAIGLPAEPDDARWLAEGLEVESDLVLDRDAPCPARPVPAGYEVRLLSDADDWAAVVEMVVAENARDGRHPDAEFRAFAQRRAAERAALSARGAGAFLGAFAAGSGLVAQAGIVLCGALGGARQVARYQHVATVPEHRGVGLAGHLLGAAGGWAAERGADRWEIHVDPGSAAHRLYDGLGFGPAGTTWQAYRAPSRAHG